MFGGAFKVEKIFKRHFHPTESPIKMSDFSLYRPFLKWMSYRKTGAIKPVSSDSCSLDPSLVKSIETRYQDLEA